ncbi:hypothetical protein HAX54_036130 [Datura stramonium]|uniref:Uncharacterized protein n=1 Tax=Datura stramonium TaxID=4076 RepID=A0ABS8VJN9_DATST|nr:hypothetical protein [Datura stramonium]
MGVEFGNPRHSRDVVRSKQPHGYDSRDMTLFKDDDGVAYLIYSSEHNKDLHIGPLNEEYIDVTQSMRKILIGQHREAPALFKHQGTYYMITPGWALVGLQMRPLLMHRNQLWGLGRPLETQGIGGNKIFRLTTFFAQSTFVVPLSGLPGLFIFMAYRWNPADLKDSRWPVWLPRTVGRPLDHHPEYNFGFPLWSRVSIYCIRNGVPL